MRAVLFDAGNTLVFLDARRMRDVLAGVGHDVTEARIVAAEEEARRLLLERVGEGWVGSEAPLWRAYFQALLAATGLGEELLPVAGEALKREHARSHLWTGVGPGVPEALDRLLEGGYRLGVVSNADGRMPEVIAGVGLHRYFEFVLDSQRVGVEKPHPDIFRAAVSRMGVDPDRCAYVGDLYPVDYQGARGAGLVPVLYDPLGMGPPPARRVTSLNELPSVLAALD